MEEEHLNEIGRLTPFIKRMVNIKYHDLLPRDLVESYVEKLPRLMTKASVSQVSLSSGEKWDAWRLQPGDSNYVGSAAT